MLTLPIGKAGLHWSLSKSSSGFTLSCSGYSDRLSDLAVQLLSDFCRGEFLNDDHKGSVTFAAVKDKLVRGYKSYFESKRADSLAMYYRNLLLSSKGEGIEHSLGLAETMTLEDVVMHHHQLWADKIVAEVFYTGNVSQKDAEAFFDKATEIINASSKYEQGASNECSPWVPGPFERRLPPGQDMALHFASQNPKEGKPTLVLALSGLVANKIPNPNCHCRCVFIVTFRKRCCHNDFSVARAGLQRQVTFVRGVPATKCGDSIDIEDDQGTSI